MSNAKEPLSIEILNAKTEALFNAVQIICSHLDLGQQRSISKLLKDTADMQFSTGAHSEISQQAKALGAKVSRGLAESIDQIITTTSQT